MNPQERERRLSAAEDRNWRRAEERRLLAERDEIHGCAMSDNESGGDGRYNPDLNGEDDKLFHQLLNGPRVEPHLPPVPDDLNDYEWLQAQAENGRTA